MRASEERYRVLFERNPIPMWVYDRANWRFLQVNEAAIAHYGHDAPWATVRPPLVALTAEQAKALVAELEQKTFTMPGLAGR